LTQLRREAQALKEQPISPSAPLPKHGKQPKQTLSLTNLPYFVRRTGSNQLPVYLVTKAGGTKQLTKIQKTEGDLDALRSDLAQTLGVDTRSPDVSINRLTGHIIVKVCSTRSLPFVLGLSVGYNNNVYMTGLAETRDCEVPPGAQLLNSSLYFASFRGGQSLDVYTKAFTGFPLSEGS
jgi:hypothetical protein